MSKNHVTIAIITRGLFDNLRGIRSIADISVISLVITLVLAREGK